MLIVKPAYYMEVPVLEIWIHHQKFEFQTKFSVVIFVVANSVLGLLKIICFPQSFALWHWQGLLIGEVASYILMEEEAFSR